jgi:hypothetical protein
MVKMEDGDIMDRSDYDKKFENIPIKEFSSWKK